MPEYNEETEVHVTLSNQRDGTPDIGQMLLAVLDSIEITRTESGSEEITVNESAARRAYTMSVREQNDEPRMMHQPISNTSTTSYPSGPHSDPLQTQVIPDSLTTLTQYLMHLRQECDSTDRGENYTSQTTGSCGVGAQVLNGAGTLPAGLPTPASMAVVLRSTRNLLNEQIEERLLQVARYMENQANATVQAERMEIQAYASVSGILLHNLGAFLLELGRSMMTLRMGSTPADAVVNTGPALFVSMTGPNPMTVQPQPLLLGTSHGVVPVGTSQQRSGFMGGSVRTRLIEMIIDVIQRAAADRIDGPEASDSSFWDPNVSSSLQDPDQHARIVGNGRSSVPNPSAQLPNSGLPDFDSTTSNVSSVDGENASLGSAGVPGSLEQGSYSHSQQDPLLPPSPKRQERE